MPQGYSYHIIWNFDGISPLKGYNSWLSAFYLLQVGKLLLDGPIAWDHKLFHMIFLCPLLHFATSCQRFAIDPNLTEITQVRNHFCLGIIGLYERDSLSVYSDALIVIIPFLSKKEKSLFEYFIRVDCWLTLLCPI